MSSGISEEIISTPIPCRANSRIIAWMDERQLESGPLVDVELLAGGTQNVLVRFRRGEREFVLRRPPPHKRANSDETMRREARVLAALAAREGRVFGGR